MKRCPPSCSVRSCQPLSCKAHACILIITCICRQCNATQRWLAQQLPLSTNPACGKLGAALAAGPELLLPACTARQMHYVCDMRSVDACRNTWPEPGPACPSFAAGTLRAMVQTRQGAPLSSGMPNSGWLTNCFNSLAPLCLRSPLAVAALAPPRCQPTPLTCGSRCSACAKPLAAMKKCLRQAWLYPFNTKSLPA